MHRFHGNRYLNSSFSPPFTRPISAAWCLPWNSALCILAGIWQASKKATLLLRCRWAEYEWLPRSHLIHQPLPPRSHFTERRLLGSQWWITRRLTGNASVSWDRFIHYVWHYWGEVGCLFVYLNMRRFTCKELWMLWMTSHLINASMSASFCWGKKH